MGLPIHSQAKSASRNTLVIGRSLLTRRRRAVTNRQRRRFEETLAALLRGLGLASYCVSSTDEAGKSPYLPTSRFLVKMVEAMSSLRSSGGSSFSRMMTCVSPRVNAKLW